MNITVQNRRDIEFDLADLEVVIKDYILLNGTIVSIIFYVIWLTPFLYGYLVLSYWGKDACPNMDLKKEI